MHSPLVPQSGILDVVSMLLVACAAVPLALLMWPIAWMQRLIDSVSSLGLRLLRLFRLTFPRAVFVTIMASILAGHASVTNFVIFPMRARETTAIQNALHWLAANGGSSDRVGIAPEGGLLARKAVFPGDTIAAVPLDIVVHSRVARTALRWLLGPESAAGLRSVDGNTALALFLMTQRVMRAANDDGTASSDTGATDTPHVGGYIPFRSHYSPYIDILPSGRIETADVAAGADARAATSDINDASNGVSDAASSATADTQGVNLTAGIRNLPAFYGPHELQELKGSEVRDDTVLHQTHVRQVWERWCRLTSTVDGERLSAVFGYSVFPPPISARDGSPFCVRFTLHEFQWAYSLVASRAFDMEGATRGGGVRGDNWVGMVPVVDMANHGGASVNAEYYFEEMACKSSDEPFDDDEAAAPTAVRQFRAMLHRTRQDSCGTFMLRATRPIGVGQSITLSYGALNNMHSIMSYGFARPEWDLGSFAVRLRDTSFDFRLFHFARAFVAAAAEARAEGAGIRKIWNGAGDGDGTTQPSCGILWRCVDAPDYEKVKMDTESETVAGAGSGDDVTRGKVILEALNYQESAAMQARAVAQESFAKLVENPSLTFFMGERHATSPVMDELDAWLRVVLHMSNEYDTRDEPISPIASRTGLGTRATSRCKSEGALPLRCGANMAIFVEQPGSAPPLLPQGYGVRVLCPTGCLREARRTRNGASDVVGSGLYRGDSDICVAARHHTGKDGGLFMLVRHALPAEGVNFHSSAVHGVTSRGASAETGFVHPSARGADAASASAFYILAIGERQCVDFPRHSESPFAHYSVGTIRAARRVLQRLLLRFPHTVQEDEKLLHFGAEGTGVKEMGSNSIVDEANSGFSEWRNLFRLPRLRRWWYMGTSLDPDPRLSLRVRTPWSYATRSNDSGESTDDGTLDYVQRSIVIVRWSEKRTLLHVDSALKLALAVLSQNGSHKDQIDGGSQLSCYRGARAWVDHLEGRMQRAREIGTYQWVPQRFWRLSGLFQNVCRHLQANVMGVFDGARSGRWMPANATLLDRPLLHLADSGAY